MKKQINLKNFDPRFKVITCQNCNQKLRVPIKFNKILQISCNKCNTLFTVSFKNPLFDLFVWNTQINLLENIKIIFRNFSNADKIVRKKILLIIALLGICISLFINSI